MAKRKSTRETDKQSITTLKKKVTSLDKKITAMSKDVAFVKRMMSNPVAAQLILTGRAKPGQKIMTSVGVGIDWARRKKESGDTDTLLELGMPQREIDTLDEDFELVEEEP